MEGVRFTAWPARDGDERAILVVVAIGKQIERMVFVVCE